MILFDEIHHREQNLVGRYGIDVDRLSRASIDSFLEEGSPPGLPDGEQKLRGARWLVEQDWQLREDPPKWFFPDEPKVERQPRKLPRPRLFVSHRRADRECAMRVAWEADQVGFDVWIDVLDPILSSPRGLTSMAIAAVIEMALLNATHLCAVFTPATAGSQWLPYEYGRVKDRVTMSMRAACAIHTSLPGKKLPEWVHLGAKAFDQPEVVLWLKDEARRWGVHPLGPTGHWPTSEPPPADLWEACCAKDPGACAET